MLCSVLVLPCIPYIFAYFKHAYLRSTILESIGVVTLSGIGDGGGKSDKRTATGLSSPHRTPLAFPFYTAVNLKNYKYTHNI